MLVATLANNVEKKQSNAKQSNAKQCKAKQSKAKRENIKTRADCFLTGYCLFLCIILEIFIYIIKSISIKVHST